MDSDTLELFFRLPRNRWDELSQEMATTIEQFRNLSSIASMTADEDILHEWILLLTEFDEFLRQMPILSTKLDDILKKMKEDEEESNHGHGQNRQADGRERQSSRNRPSSKKPEGSPRYSVEAGFSRREKYSAPFQGKRRVDNGTGSF